MRILVLWSLCLLVAAAQQPPMGKSVIVGGTGATTAVARMAPPITFHQALPIAEKYITAHRVPIERYWLREVTWVHPKELKLGRPWWENSYWHLWWSGAASDNVYIEVDMSGHAVRRPSE